MHQNAHLGNEHVQPRMIEKYTFNALFVRRVEPRITGIRLNVISRDKDSLSASRSGTRRTTSYSCTTKITSPPLNQAPKHAPETGPPCMAPKR